MTGSLGIRSGSYGSLEKQILLQQLQQQQNGGLGIFGGGSLLPSQNTGRTKAGKTVKDKDKGFLWICKFAGSKKVGMLLLCLVSAIVFLWVLYMGKGGDTTENDRVPSIRLNNSTLIDDSGSTPVQLMTVLSPPSYFLGYSLPPDHPCNKFPMPPPPADRKRTGPRPCPVCYLPVEEAIGLMPTAPSFSPVVTNLSYIHENPLTRKGEFGGSEFGGFPTLQQRSDSFDIKGSMSIHCGFVRGEKPGRNTGYDISEMDLAVMDECTGVVVASAIFGAFDIIQQPQNISDHSRKTVCFFMFVDEETEAYLRKIGDLDNSKKVGIWRIVVVYNLPYTDGRRNGKIPKLLTHRIFPNARFSLWIDGKLELVVDPYQILERHLWRKNATFAISRHYRRFDTFVEAEANKAAGKYDNASIDFQINFYRKEGLTPYSESKLPITSDVPEGCVIIREHLPITNLFTCLWFNEVDRFTSRDQLSFSTVRDKIQAKTNWTLNMFLDCERRNFVVQKYHRDVLEHMNPPPPPLPHPPPLIAKPVEKIASPTVRRSPARHVRRSSGRRHRKAIVSGRDGDPG